MPKKKQEPVTGEQVQDPRETLRLFVIEAKVRAFRRRYAPATEDDADRTFSESELRQFFGAAVRPQGDPLVIYLDEFLEPSGYSLTVNSITEEPCLFVKNIYDNGNTD